MCLLSLWRCVFKESFCAVSDLPRTLEQTDQGSCGFCPAEMMSTCFTPTGCRSFTLSFTVLAEMLLGSASVPLYQDQPRLLRPILSLTGSDLGGLTAKINQWRFQHRQSRDSRKLQQGFPLKNTLKTAADAMPCLDSSFRGVCSTTRAFGCIFGFPFNPSGKEVVTIECCCF